MNASDLPVAGFRAFVRALRPYHRHEIHGIEHALGPALLLGYHGRGLPLDLAMLALEVEARTGRLPIAIAHEALFHLPVFKDIFRGLGAQPGNVPRLHEALSAGHAVFIAPGGAREGMRAAGDRYRVDWGRHRGYLRFALSLPPGTPIVPVGSSGVDDMYLGLLDGERWGRRLGLPWRLPFWPAVGVGGLWPLALPFPARVVTVVGAPVDLKPADLAGEPGSAEWLEAAHALVTARVQACVDEARRRAA